MLPVTPSGQTGARSGPCGSGCGGSPSAAMARRAASRPAENSRRRAGTAPDSVSPDNSGYSVPGLQPQRPRKAAEGPAPRPQDAPDQASTPRLAIRMARRRPSLGKASLLPVQWPAHGAAVSPQPRQGAPSPFDMRGQRLKHRKAEDVGDRDLAGPQPVADFAVGLHGQQAVAARAKKLSLAPTFGTPRNRLQIAARSAATDDAGPRTALLQRKGRRRRRQGSAVHLAGWASAAWRPG